MKKLLSLAALAALLFVTACKKKDDPKPSSSSSYFEFEDSYYITFVKGSATIRFEDGVDGIEVGGNVDYTHSYFCGLGTFFSTDPDRYQPEASINFYKDYIDEFPTKSEAYDAFVVGTGNGFGNISNETEGFRITYLDENDVLWSTDLSTGNQTGSAINITKKSPKSSEYFYNVSGTFNCTFYNENGDSFTATDGEFVGLFSHAYDE